MRMRGDTNIKGTDSSDLFIFYFMLVIMCKYVLLFNSTGCPDNYARIVNVSSDVHRYGTIVFDNLNDRYSMN